MEDPIRAKTSFFHKKSMTTVPCKNAKPSKAIPLDAKKKTPNQNHFQGTSLKDSNHKIIPPQQDINPRPSSGKGQHRRIKSDPIPNSPYFLVAKGSKISQSIKPTNSPNLKPIKGHRRIHSDTEYLNKNHTGISISNPPDDIDREKIIETIKQCSISIVPLITTLDFYKIGKPLGKGSFGKVYLGIHKLTGLKVAIKMIEKSYMQNEHSRKKVFQEVYIMNKIHDKNVIRLLELFESPRHLNIVLEYAGGGDLLQLLRARGKLSEQDARPIFKQIIDAVIACHKEDVIHRDIKLDNILLNEDMTLIKLCDFGVSRVAKFGTKINEQCGTPAYLAPEIIVNEGYEPFFVDVWSMGILLYALVSATVPFRAKTVPELHKIILRGKYDFPQHFSEELKDLVKNMLNPIPHLRIKLNDLKNHQ